MSPTQRTLAHLRKLGYLAAVVEKWNPHAKVRVDLFGIVDVVAISTAVESDLASLFKPLNGYSRTRYTLAVQATSGSNVSKRIEKMQAATHRVGLVPATWRKGQPDPRPIVATLPALLEAGWILEVWGWRKSARSKRWELRRVPVTAAGLVDPPAAVE